MELQRFKTYVTEAKVSAKNFDKAVNIYVRLLQKHLGIKLYRFGGKQGYVPINKGASILYTGSNKTAYAFNYVKDGIESISVWQNFKLYNKSDFNISLGGIGLFQAGQKLISLIKKPKPGTYYMVPDPNIKEDINDNTTNILSEAKLKRLKPIEFLQVIQNNLKMGQDITKMTWENISDIAMENGVQVPTAVRKLGSGGKRGRGGQKPTYDLTHLANPNVVSPTDKNVEPILYLKVTPQDPHTKRFMSAKNNKSAQQMYNKIQDILDNPPVKELARDVNNLFGILKRLIKVVIGNYANGLIVYGIGGIGKTYTVESTLKEEGLSLNKDYFKINSKITTASLYEILYTHRDGKILVFDDADGFWKDDDASNMLKAALDTYPVRTVSWYTKQTYNVSPLDDAQKQAYNQEVDLKLKAGDDKIKFPSSFDFKSRIIFISNKPRDFFDSAVLTRVKSIDMTLTDDEIFERILFILPSLGKPEVPIECKREILERVRKGKDSKELLKSINLRVFEDAENMYLSGDPNWIELINF